VVRMRSQWDEQKTEERIEFLLGRVGRWTGVLGVLVLYDGQRGDEAVSLLGGAVVSQVSFKLSKLPSSRGDLVARVFSLWTLDGRFRSRVAKQLICHMVEVGYGGIQPCLSNNSNSALCFFPPFPLSAESSACLGVQRSEHGVLFTPVTWTSDCIHGNGTEQRNPAGECSSP
jgi:hypothetical protein